MDAREIMWYAVAFLCVVAGTASAFAFVQLGRLLGGLHRDIDDLLTEEVAPLVHRAGTSLDIVNDQLRKAGTMMDSAVDLTEQVDTAARAVSMAVTEPVKKTSAVLAGLNEALRSLRRNMGEEHADADTDFEGRLRASEGAGR